MTTLVFTRRNIMCVIKNIRKSNKTIEINRENEDVLMYLIYLAAKTH